MPKDYNATNRTPIDIFSLEYEMPLDLALLMIGKTEEETEHNTKMFKDYIGGVVKQYHTKMFCSRKKGNKWEKQKKNSKTK